VEASQSRAVQNYKCEEDNLVPNITDSNALMATGKQKRTGLIATLAMVVVMLFATACGDSSGNTSTGSSSSSGGSAADYTSPQQYGGSYSGGRASGDTQTGEQFARWVLDQDPNRQYITDAVVRNESNLGVKVQPNITKADAQKLLVALTEGMAKTFPNKPLTVVAFYQSGDKLAQANYDNQTNKVNVQFAQ